MQTTLKETLDRLPGGLLITDQESRVLYASAALERRTGFSVAEIVGKKPGELWGGKMRRQFYRSLWHRIESEERPFVGEVKNTKKNGAQHDEHIFIVPIRDQHGVTRYFAEIHPLLPDRESELAFAREFLSRTEGMNQDKEFFSWVFRRLATETDGSVLSFEVPTGHGTVLDAASFLRESFIKPTERVFLRRQEDALLVAAAQNDGEQFSALYEKYVLMIREYFLRRLSGERVLADDLTQEVFVRAFRYLPGFRMVNASYATYLIRVAHSVLMNHYRKESYDTVSLYGNEERVEAVSLPETIPERTMDALLAGLTESERAIMLFKYRDGLKVREISGRVGKSENAVKLILSRTRKKMKKSLLEA